MRPSNDVSVYEYNETRYVSFYNVLKGKYGKYEVHGYWAYDTWHEAMEAAREVASQYGMKVKVVDLSIN